MLSLLHNTTPSPLLLPSLFSMLTAPYKYLMLDEIKHRITSVLPERHKKHNIINSLSVYAQYLLTMHPKLGLISEGSSTVSSLIDNHFIDMFHVEHLAPGSRR